MAMTRMQLRHAAIKAKYDAERNKPPTRKQAQVWLQPIMNALVELRSGEIDAYRGYAITRIHKHDTDFARVDHCINGFVAMIERVMPEFDVSPMTKLSNKLESGILLTVDEIETCIDLINQCEDKLITIKRCVLKDAALTEQVNIELERLGMKAA